MNALQPTAELRPLADKQTDERDLMPYPLLNRIERLAFYDRLPPAGVLAQLVAEDPHADARAAAHLRAALLHSSGAATSGSASATRPRFTSTTTTWTRAPGCAFRYSAAGLGRAGGAVGGHGQVLFARNGVALGIKLPAYTGVY